MTHLICLLQISKELRRLLNAIWIFVGMIDKLDFRHQLAVTSQEGERRTANLLYDF